MKTETKKTYPNKNTLFFLLFKSIHHSINFGTYKRCQTQENGSLKYYSQIANLVNFQNLEIYLNSPL